MRITYICDSCGAHIADLEMDEVDEQRLGFSSLTEEERADIIRTDQEKECIYVSSLCDDCISALGLDSPDPVSRKTWLN